MLFNLIVVAVLAGLTQAQGPPAPAPATNCSDIPNVAMNYVQLANTGILNLLATNNPNLTCTSGLLTGPANGFYYFMLIQNGVVTYSFNVNGQTDDTAGSTLNTCSTGTPFQYKFLSYNLTGDNPYFIAYLCDPTTGKIPLIKAYGRSGQDGTFLQNEINTNVGGLLDGTLINAWDTCTTNNNCQGYSLSP